MSELIPTRAGGDRGLRVSHIALVTSNLGRCRAFYEDVIGVRTAVVLRMNHPPYLRHALMFVDDRTLLHAVEQPGYDPADDGIGNEIGHRGRIDHFGFLVGDVQQLETMRDRLVAAHASDGIVTSRGCLLSVHFRDPDGLDGEVNAPNPAFNPTNPDAEGDGDTVEEMPDPAWFDRLLGATRRS